ncbi:unnamed protein product [Thelazia callipaeda]|uniref:RGS domain-containing protein n=1 Tax=Thelazia callipaeda TaxID=103827 RepID=A0A0N5CM03_THECL|nr:unnamed protein product [Thelazia callipaeda]
MSGPRAKSGALMPPGPFQAQPQLSSESCLEGLGLAHSECHKKQLSDMMVSSLAVLEDFISYTQKFTLCSHLCVDAYVLEEREKSRNAHKCQRSLLQSGTDLRRANDGLQLTTSASLLKARGLLLVATANRDEKKLARAFQALIKQREREEIELSGFYQASIPRPSLLSIKSGMSYSINLYSFFIDADIHPSIQSKIYTESSVNSFLIYLFGRFDRAD